MCWLLFVLLTVVLWGPISLFVIFEHKILVFCSGNFPMCLWVWGSSLISLPLDSVYFFLCGDPWYTWTWALCREIRTNQFAFFYILTTRWTNNICWKCFSFLHLMILVLLSKIEWQYVCVFISGASIMFRWSIFLTFYLYQTDFIFNAL